MHLPAQIAQNLRETYFGKNWTYSCMKEHLEDVTWQEAVTQVHSLNTIVTLVYHSYYYVDAVRKVLNGGPLDAHQDFSFTHPPVESAEDWSQFLDKVWTCVEECATLIEQLPEDKMWEPFAGGKYGNYYRNLHGIMEHTYYHTGQIVWVKKFLRAEP